jgi:hypothetical protein
MPRNTLIKTKYKNNYNETIWVSINFAFYGREFNQLKKKVTLKSSAQSESANVDAE